MNEAERDAMSYDLAKQYLVGLKKVDPKITERKVNSYLDFPDKAKPQSTPEIYQLMLEAAQNAGMKGRVVGGAIGGVENLGEVLCNFDPDQVLKKFPAPDWKPVLQEVKSKLKPHGRIRSTSRAIWPHYCITILSGARFLTKFAGPEEQVAQTLRLSRSAVLNVGTGDKPQSF